MQRSRPIKLAPSILTADFGYLAAAVEEAAAGGADMIHLDVMDGMFVPNITFGPPVVAAVRRATSLPLDVHLMVHEPGRYLADFAQAGADSLTVHVEASLHLSRTVQEITALGCQVGVALNPATPVESVREVLPFLDLVLVMTVSPGFGGQRFIETSTSKVRRMKRLLEELNPTCDLQVDGGVNLETIVDVATAGANIFVVGSAAYNGEAPVAENLATLRQALAG
ncbi:MAG: ribulose-phosphate 3-epimerase [Chloroflexi bacterium]|nr:MAG: ribulose-phosphate 3-epimerase [Chloroflexota bacterium]